MSSRKQCAIALLCAVLAGCGKPSGKPAPSGAEHGAPTVGGAAQAVRGAVNRTVTLNELNNLRLFIDTASNASGKMPTKDQIMQAAKEDPKLHEMLTAGAIVLTGTTQREGVWAYVAEAMTSGGYAVLNTGVEKLTAAELKQRLKTGN
jgi:hypothetical protein